MYQTFEPLTGDQCCILCYNKKEKMAQFRDAFELRTHEKAALHVRDKKNQRGHQHLPVLNIDWKNVMIDTLHMFLRIGGKLLNQLIGWTIDQGRTGALEAAFSDIGITFWLRKESTKQGPSTYKWKTLTAKELKTAIKDLPHQMSNIINDIGGRNQVPIDALQGPQLTRLLRDRNETVPRAVSERKAKLKRLLGEEAMVSLSNTNDDNTEIRVVDIKHLWKEFIRVYDMLRHPEQHAEFKEAATKWCEMFRDMTYTEDITPYIHYFGTHAGDQLASHPFLHFINCETIEKKNHIQTRRYHLATQKGGGRSRSKWAEQLMQLENRELFAAMNGIGLRKKRAWGTNRVANPDPGYAGSSEDDSDEDDEESNAPEPDGGDEDGRIAPEPDGGDEDDRIVYDGDQDDL
ncbi:PREDICTED: uncharacterized protein LOC109475068 [Branchiostoma belcheri]|uniref:Uncharacterized protein LOC109475068 n=1 Tax=Branchiostoma belcheri TaxID=7741 RepID=A0A6P4Z3L9_BRABE|nr:PREDICTED: uncharacterized protein LOC109475068 [Branchiostoma belcheri]